jgi:hypothetical protein
LHRRLVWQGSSFLLWGEPGVRWVGGVGFSHFRKAGDSGPVQNSGASKQQVSKRQFFRRQLVETWLVETAACRNVGSSVRRLVETAGSSKRQLLRTAAPVETAACRNVGSLDSAFEKYPPRTAVLQNSSPSKTGPFKNRAFQKQGLTKTGPYKNRALQKLLQRLRIAGYGGAGKMQG